VGVYAELADQPTAADEHEDVLYRHALRPPE